MKTKTRLISNSSSSSFLLAYNASDFEKCPTCGLGAKTPLEIAEESNDYNISIRCENFDEYTKRVEDDILEEQNEINILLLKDPNEIVSKYSNWTTKRFIEYHQENIAQLMAHLENCREIASRHDNFVLVNVSQHGKAYEYISELIEAKKVVLVNYDS